MEKPVFGTLRIIARTLIAAGCVAVVVAVRPAVGWGSLAMMLTALAVLLALLASYNRRFR